MDRLWKLPAIELSPTAEGGWAVQSEAGLGIADAVFLPLHEEELALDARTQLQLTKVDDASWTPVPIQAARCPDATQWLCLLRYDHPDNRPGTTFFVPDTGGGKTVGREELLQALARVKGQLAGRLPLHLVPSPGVRPSAARAGNGFRMAFASCQYPAGMLDRPVAHRSYERLARYLAKAEGPVPERLLLLGDQVYTDATYGFIDPARLDDRYRLPYEDFTDRENGPFAALPQTFLALRRMVLDDHEIRDNWQPGPGPDPERDGGLAGYWKYQRRRDPPADGEVHLTESGAQWRLFMADSRTAREPRNEDTVHAATILGQAQTRQLHDWLRAPRDGALGIVTCASMLLPRVRTDMDDPLYLDGWQGYPASLHGLLALLCEEEARDLVFLSGDAHLACDARVTVTSGNKQARFASLHAPALYAPYPFANEDPENLLLEDSFAFEVDGRSYRCEVQASVLAGGRCGCGLLHAERRDGEWDVAYEVLEPERVV